MKLKLAALAILTVMVFRDGRAAQDDLNLNLAGPEVLKELEAITGRCSGSRTGGGALHHPETFKKPDLPLKRQILSINGTDFRFGDYITAELRLTNVGDKELMLPWDIHAETVYGPKPECEWPKTPGATGLRAVLAVDLASATGQTGQSATVFLYGISSDPESYRNLPPGKSATIKVSGRVYIAPPSTAAPGDWGKREYSESFAACAEFKLDNSSMMKPNANLRSINEFQIRVTIPREIVTQE